MTWVNVKTHSWYRCFMTSTDAKVALGQQQAQAGEYVAASNTFEAVLAEDPNNLAARISLAHVSSYLGHHDEAERILIEVIESEPARLDLRITLGQLYAHLGRRADAIARFREVIEVDPVNADAWAGITNLASNPDRAPPGHGVVEASDASPVGGAASEAHWGTHTGTQGAVAKSNAACRPGRLALMVGPQVLAPKHAGGPASPAKQRVLSAHCAMAKHIESPRHAVAAAVH